MIEIKDAVVVITGSAGGIGEELAKYCVRQGGRVVLGDVSPEGLTRVEGELKALGGAVAAMVCDITNETDCGKMADLAIEKFGQINLVAPCAGITRDALPVAPDRKPARLPRKCPWINFKQSSISISRESF